jgi:hypothetical protein
MAEEMAAQEVEADAPMILLFTNNQRKLKRPQRMIP